ncbi:MAG: DUF4258 domain-containing protein [Vicinamibacterales bacterium]
MGPPKEPLSPIEARKLMREIVATGTVAFSDHAIHELTKDNLTQADAVNAIKAGAVEPAEFERGSWRYRVHTVRVWIVVVFRSVTHLVVVTAWKVGR